MSNSNPYLTITDRIVDLRGIFGLCLADAKPCF